MELEFRESFLKDVNHIREKGVKKKIAAVITEVKAASSLSEVRNVKKTERKKSSAVTRIALRTGGFDTTYDEHAGLLNHRVYN